MPKWKLSKKKASEIKTQVLNRIKIIFQEAESNFKKDPAIANRQVFLARKLSMKFKVQIPRELKRRFCKHCYNYLVPGKNCRVRLANHKVVYYCLDCKKFARFPYLREIKARRSEKV